MEESSASAPVAPQPEPQQPQVPQSSPPTMTRLPGPIALLKESWEVYKNKKKTIILLSLVPLLFVAIPLGVLVGVITWVSTQSQNSFQDSIVFFIALFAIMGVLVIVMQLVYALMYTGYMMLVRDREKEWSVKALIKESKGYILGYFWITFLVGFLTTGGFFLFLIPGILLSLWFSQAVYVLITENKRGMFALLTSKAYMQGNMLAYMGRQIALLLLLIGMQLPFLFLMFYFQIQELPDYYSTIMQLLLNFASYFVITPISIIYGYLLFTYIKQRKGEVTISAITGSTKIKYFLLGLVGLVMPILLFGLLMFGLLTQQRQLREMNLRNSELRQQYEQFDQNSEDLLLDPANESFY